MAVNNRLLLINPDRLIYFHGPFNEICRSELQLTNLTGEHVIYRLQTRSTIISFQPKCGIICPHQRISVAVIVQPFEFDDNEQNKQSLIVQAMLIPELAVDSQDNLWNAAPPESLMDTKLKCVFEMPDGIQQTMSPETNTSTESAAHDEEIQKSKTTRSADPNDAENPFKLALEKALRTAVGNSRLSMERLNDAIRIVEFNLTALEAASCEPLNTLSSIGVHTDSQKAALTKIKAEWQNMQQETETAEKCAMYLHVFTFRF